MAPHAVSGDRHERDAEAERLLDRRGRRRHDVRRQKEWDDQSHGVRRRRPSADHDERSDAAEHQQCTRDPAQCVESPQREHRPRHDRPARPVAKVLLDLADRLASLQPTEVIGPVRAVADARHPQRPLPRTEVRPSEPRPDGHALGETARRAPHVVRLGVRCVGPVLDRLQQVGHDPVVGYRLGKHQQTDETRPAGQPAERRAGRWLA